MALRNTVTHITELVFPVSKEHVERQKLRLLRSGHEYVSNLPLQIMYYCNVCYFPFWAALNGVAIAIKYPYVNSLFITADVAVLAAFSVVECIRLYLGYAGNLRENVPQLAGSWMLSLIIQTPLIFFLLFFESMVITPPERAANALMALFIVMEDITAYFAVQVMNTYQLAKFHLKQFHDIERVNRGFEPDDQTEYYENTVAMAERPHATAGASARSEQVTKRTTTENPSMNIERLD